MAQIARRGLYVVGIGASSGALSSELQSLLRHPAANPGFALVIVVHLSPEHESHLPQLLQPHTAMPVHQVAATVGACSARLLSFRPSQDLDTTDTHLRLSEVRETAQGRAPIDHFLRTLAATHDGTASASSDGSRLDRDDRPAPHQGMRWSHHRARPRGGRVRQHALVQRHRNGPGSTWCCLLEYSRRDHAVLRHAAAIAIPADSDALDHDDQALLDEVLIRLQKSTQQDFRVYKRATLLRRIRKRNSGKLLHVTKLRPYVRA